MLYLKRANVKDAEELVRIKVDAFFDEIKKYNCSPRDYDSIEKQVISINNYFVYKIMYGNSCTGGLTVENMGNEHYHIKSAYLRSVYQNKGLGRKAFLLLFKLFPNAKKWTLETPYLSYRNHHFYEKLGFVKVCKTKLNEDGFYLFLYEKGE